VQCSVDVASTCRQPHLTFAPWYNLAMNQRPYWQLPPGVTRGEWEYFESPNIANMYDDYFSYNELFAYDVPFILSHFDAHSFGRGGFVADLGCGTGRALVPIVAAGYRGLAIDLSRHMLSIVADKAFEGDLPIHNIQANLVELDGIQDGVVDHAISMFSTLGMIAGREHRHQALAHVFRILRPGGLLVLHIHNRLYNLYDPGGPKWLIANWLRATFRGDVELGDKYYDYRGVHNMFLHVFSRREICNALRLAGFEVQTLVPLEAKRRRPLRAPWLCQKLRANGWIIVAAKPTEAK
jgi:SAM-dependent methyltransferase